MKPETTGKQVEIPLKEFLSYVNSGAVPTGPPEGAVIASDLYLPIYETFKTFTLLCDAKRACNKKGMWPIVDLVWTKALADVIGNGRVLEVMAGGGWIAKALNSFGVDVMATDDYSWADYMHKNMTPVFPVDKLDGLEAVKNVPADVLLISWPHFESMDIMRICKEWGKLKPIIYIGEGEGGATAPSAFFSHFKEIDHPHIPLKCWPGIHDFVSIGYWK